MGLFSFLDWVFMSSCSYFSPFYLAAGLFYAKINACREWGVSFSAWFLPNERRDGRFADLHFFVDAMHYFFSLLI